MDYPPPKVFAISMEPIDPNSYEDELDTEVARRNLNAIETVFGEFKESFFAYARQKKALT